MQEFNFIIEAHGKIDCLGRLSPIHIRITCNRINSEKMSLLLTLPMGSPGGSSMFIEHIQTRDYQLYITTRDRYIIILNGIHNPEIINSSVYKFDIISFYKVKYLPCDITIPSATIRCKLLPNVPVLCLDFHDDSRAPGIEWGSENTQYTLSKAKHSDCCKNEYGTTYQKSILIPELYIEKKNFAAQKLFELTDQNSSLSISIFEICVLLMFCFRKNMLAYEIDVHDSSYNELFFGRIAISTHNYPSELSPLIDYHHLTNSGFKLLFENFNSLDSHIRASIKNSIGSLHGSRIRHSTIEKKLFSCHAALDAICNAVSKNKTLHKSEMKKLRKYLEKKIDKFTPPIPDAEKERIKSKLPELARVAYTDNIIQICREYNIKTHDLWGRKTFRKGLAEAVQMRNKLFHQSHIDDVFSIASACTRLQHLTERIILKVLGWPEDKLHARHKDDLIMENRMDLKKTS